MITANAEALTASAYLWHDRSLYIGDITSHCQLCTHAPALAVFMDGPAEVFCEGRSVVTHSMLVQTNQWLRIDARGGRIAALFLDPLGREYRSLIPKLQRHGTYSHFDLRDHEGIADVFDEIQATKASADAVMDWLDLWVTADAPMSVQDQRIQAVLKTIKSHTSENLSSQKLAEQLNISDAHLMRLFKRTIGIPLRRYRNWHRLAAAAHLWLKSDFNISMAAVSVGFSDTSHFNRYFKQSLGMPPGFLLGFHRPVDIFCERRNDDRVDGAALIPY